MHDGDVRIGHLALSVSDAERSRRFYLDEIGLTGTSTREDWGYRLRLDGAFMLALIEGDPLPGDVVERVHFGCHLPNAESVHQLRRRLGQAGIPEVEWVEEDGYTSLKVQDPDGYVVELSWDIQ